MQRLFRLVIDELALGHTFTHRRGRRAMGKKRTSARVLFQIPDQARKLESLIKQEGAVEDKSLTCHR